MARRLMNIQKRRAAEHAEEGSMMQTMRDPDRDPYVKARAMRDPDRHTAAAAAPVVVTKKKKKAA